MVAWVTAVTTTPTTSVANVSTQPFDWLLQAGDEAGLLPQVTAVMICIGMMQSRK